MKKFALMPSHGQRKRENRIGTLSICLLARRYWYKWPPTPNAQTQIAVFRIVLPFSEPDPLKFYSSVWWLRLVGDVHQPLHCASRYRKFLLDGHAGGNLVKLRLHPRKDELHAFSKHPVNLSSAFQVQEVRSPAGDDVRVLRAGTRHGGCRMSGGKGDAEKARYWQKTIREAARQSIQSHPHSIRWRSGATRFSYVWRNASPWNGWSAKS